MKLYTTMVTTMFWP